MSTHSAHGGRSRSSGGTRAARSPSSGQQRDTLGQRMSFTRAEFAQALAQAERFGNRNRNETLRVTIRGRSYIAKTVIARGRYTEAVQQRNEAAAAAGLRALGYPDLAVREVYVVRGPGGRMYSVQSMEEGSAQKFGATAERAQTIPETTLQRLVLAQYLLGMQDNHAGNLVTTSDGRVTKIDNGYAFKRDTLLERRDAARDIWRLQAGGDEQAMRWSVATLRAVLSRQEAVMRMAGRFGLEAAEQRALAGRFAALARATANGQRSLSYQELRAAVGMRVSPWANKGGA